MRYYEVQVAGAAASRADRELPRELRGGPGGERAGLLVAHVDPVDRPAPADGVRHGVQAVADDTVHASDTAFGERAHQCFSHRLRHYHRLSSLRHVAGATGVPAASPCASA